MNKESIRVEIDNRNQTLNAKIRDAQNEKIPYMLILGDKEEKNKTASKRGRSGKDFGEVKIKTFIKNIKRKIATKALNLI